MIVTKRRLHTGLSDGIYFIYKLFTQIFIDFLVGFGINFTIGSHGMYSAHGINVGVSRFLIELPMLLAPFPSSVKC